jgi:hypothetical protein
MVAFWPLGTAAVLRTVDGANRAELAATGG